MRTKMIFVAITAGVVLCAALPVFAAQPNGSSTPTFRNHDRDDERNARSTQNTRARGNVAAPARPVAQAPAAQPQRRFDNERPRVANHTSPRPVARAPEPVRPVVAEHAPRHRPVVHTPVVERPVIHRPVIVERPVYVERPVFVHRPVVYERPYIVERPVYAEYPVYDEPQYPYYSEAPRDETNPFGMIVGAILGAVLGNQIGGEENGQAGAAVGAILGGVIGGGL